MATCSPQELREQFATARTRFEAARRQSEAARARAYSLRLAATAAGYPRWFKVEGTLDARHVVARWWRGNLSGDGELLSRAELLVRLGERFDLDPAGSIAASLEEPLAAMLTLLRSCDRMIAVSMGPAHLPGERRPEGGH